MKPYFDRQTARNRQKLRDGTLYSAEQLETILRSASIVQILPPKPRPDMDTETTPTDTHGDHE